MGTLREGLVADNTMLSPFMSADTTIVFEPADELRLAAAAADLKSPFMAAADDQGSRTAAADAAASEMFPSDLSVPVVISDSFIHAGVNQHSYQ
jgi:hypothetical protein